MIQKSSASAGRCKQQHISGLIHTAHNIQIIHQHLFRKKVTINIFKCYLNLRSIKYHRNDTFRFFIHPLYSVGALKTIHYKRSIRLAVIVKCIILLQKSRYG